MSTQLLPPNVQPPPPPDHDTRRLGPLERYTRRGYLLFHLPFTLRLIGRCLRDPRAGAGAKLLFLGVTGLLLLVLLVPEAGADAVALLVPVVGPLFDLVGVPFEGAVDWSFLIIAIPALLGLFPAEVVRQHILELRGQLPPPR